MPGKGERRREKNYRAAHGGDTRLPPPPKPRELDALPSKLRRLIAFKNRNATTSGAPDRKGEDAGGKNKARKEKKVKQQRLQFPVESKVGLTKNADDPVADEDTDTNKDGSKRKRNRGKVVDLRFKELDENVSKSKKKKRMKFLDEKKKKRKSGKTQTVPDFPEREQVKFGEVVEAPPKLSFPKVKGPLDVSRERIRKEAIENYRNIKGWTSRPGLKLPTLGENTSS